MNKIAVILLACACSAPAFGNVFSWDNVPYTDLRGGGSITSEDGSLDISFAGNGWLQLETGGKLSYQPTELNKEAVMEMQWNGVAENISFAISGFVRNHFYEAVKVEFYLGDQSVGGQYLDLHSMEESGGWLSNVVQWSADGSFSVVTNHKADKAVVTLVTKTDSGSPVPYWVNLQISPVFYDVNQVPEPAYAVCLLAGAAALCLLRKSRRRAR